MKNVSGNIGLFCMFCIVLCLDSYGQESIFGNQSKVYLETREVLSGAIKIKIPSSFSPMHEDIVRLKYPSLKSNDVTVYSNKDGTVNILLELSDNYLDSNELPAFLVNARRQFENAPNITIEKAELVKVKEKDVVVVKFYSEAIDTKIYNALFITDVKGRKFIGTVNATFGYIPEWKFLADEIIQSMVVL